MERIALVIGATGLVGSQLVNQLITDPDYSEINIFGRRSIGIIHPKIKEHIVDFNAPESWKMELTGDVLFSSLGTTIKKAGSKDNQYRVDFTYQYEVAKAASENKVAKYVLVSSLGANAGSSIFYPRIKGELDEAVQLLDFKSIFILRPSALVGDRQEERAGENVMIKVTSFACKILPFLRKYKPIPAEIVAAAMVNLSKLAGTVPPRVIDNPDIFLAAEPNQKQH
jgi:uncharacterized protein YbjT (DUF2867 family)